MGRRGKVEPLLLTVPVDADAIVTALQQMNHDDLQAVIIALDKSVADWDFTLALCDHFAKARREFAKEHADDYPHGCLDEKCPDCKPVRDPKGVE